VVGAALKALDARRSVAIPRWSQSLLAKLPRLLPRRAVASTTAKVLRPRREEPSAAAPPLR
jgi:hypothetical protein